MSNLFSVNGKDVAGAMISGVLMAVLAYLGSLTSIFSIDWKSLVSVAVLAALTSIAKSLGTTSDGKFLGGISVK